MPKVKVNIANFKNIVIANKGNINFDKSKTVKIEGIDKEYDMQ